MYSEARVWNKVHEGWRIGKKNMHGILRKLISIIKRVANYSMVRLRHFLLNLLIWRSKLTKLATFEESTAFASEHERTRVWFRRRAIRVLSELDGIDFHRIRNGTTNLPLYNPSIIKVAGSGFLLVATESNRVMSYRWGRRPRFVRGSAFTSNLLLGSPSLDLLPPGESIISLKPLTGMQDVAADARLFNQDKNLLVVWNQGLQVESGRALTRLWIKSLESSTKIIESRVLSSPFDLLIEKNWMPLAHNEGSSIQFIHTVSPTVTLTIPLDDESSTEVRSNPGPADLTSDRGGSQLIELENGHYLAVTHSTYLFPARYYSQRLILFEKIETGFQVVSYSRPFVFKNNFDVEFASGIALVGGHVLISFGVRDLEAWICKMRADTALRLASEVPYKSDIVRAKNG